MLPIVRAEYGFTGNDAVYRETLTFRNADWVQVSKASRKYMNIDVSEETSMVTPPFEARVGFWDNMKFSRPN